MKVIPSSGVEAFGLVIVTVSVVVLFTRIEESLNDSVTVAGRATVSSGEAESPGPTSTETTGPVRSV